MSDLEVLAGATSVSINVQLYTLSTGAPLTGLVFNSSGLTAYYSFSGVSTTSTSITLATLASVTHAWATGGFIEIDATNMPGLYRFDIPNACLAASKGREVDITFNGYSGMAVYSKKIALTSWDNQNATTGGMTALPSANAGASGGVLINGSNSGTVTLAALTVTGATTLTGAVAANGGVTFTSSTGVGFIVSSTHATSAGATFSGNTSGAGAIFTGGTTGTGLSVVGGGTSGNGLNITTTSGHAINAAATGTTAHGINATGGATTSHGIFGTGGGVGHGIYGLSGGGATGDGIRGTAQSTNGNGLNLLGIGTQPGLLSTGGLTGPGIAIVGGGTSGDGVKVTTTSGHGYNVVATGVGKHGAVFTGGAAVTTSAAGHGIFLTGGASSTGVGGFAGFGLNVVGGSGSASQNGAVSGAQFVGGGTNTVASQAHGIFMNGTSSGSGLKATSGTGATGDGITATSAATNGNGFSLSGVGTGSGFIATAGATGIGFSAVGGATSGNAFTLSTSGSGTTVVPANVTQINGVSTSSVTTINANIGTLQAIAFDANNYPQVDLVDIAGSTLSTSSAQIGVNLVNVNGTSSGVSNFSTAIQAMQPFTCQTGTLSTTQTSTNLASTTAGQYVGRTLYFVSGVLSGVAVPITAYNGSGLLTYTTTPNGLAPSNGDTAIIV